MSTIRVYLPTTLGELASALSDGGFGPAPIRAHAVTEALREASGEGSDEEWEYAALMAAAEESRELVPDGEPVRRVVVAAEVQEAVPTPGEVTGVEVPGAVAMRDVAAVHADLSEADAARGEDLCWFATQEITDLVATG